MDKIYIHGLNFFAYHGVNPEETLNGQNFWLDVCLHTSVAAAGKSDDLNDTVNYAAVRKVITAAMTQQPFRLIERAATEVATKILQQFSAVSRVDVLLKKPEAPMNCEFEDVAVEISRTRQDILNS